VEPDSVEGLVRAIASLDRIDRHACRRQAEQEFSLEAMGDRTEAWFDAVLKSWPGAK
jgi:UDP-glucose:tetrahydrobiopterin glucosyltransferase